jgi:DNA-binding NarL/FixJ family response regulator
MEFLPMLPVFFHRYFIVSLLIVLSIMSIADLLADFSEGASWIHMAEEGAILCLCLFGVAQLMLSLRAQQKNIASLKQELQTARLEAAEAGHTLKEGRLAFAKVIAEQFGTWSLTKSEQEVGLLLLKGFSLSDIASLRETQEKTVRQQASAIYKKAGVSGRHSFAAWFFEDFL